MPWPHADSPFVYIIIDKVKSEVSASLRNGAVLFANRGGPGSVSQVFRKQGIDIVADTASTMASF